MYSLKKANDRLGGGLQRHELQLAYQTVIWCVHVYIDGRLILGDNSSAISLKLTAYNIFHVTISGDVLSCLRLKVKVSSFSTIALSSAIKLVQRP